MKYEDILASELDDGTILSHGPAGPAGLGKQKQLSALVSKKLQAVEDARWKFNVRDETVEVKPQVDRVVKAVLLAKEYISSAASSEPHAALAWTGVCLLLPVSALFPSSRST